MFDFSKISHPLLGHLITGIDHIAIATTSMDQCSQAWSHLLGIDLTDKETISEQQTDVGFFRFNNQTNIELICPLPDNKGLVDFVNKRGNGLHHIAFAVTDIKQAWTLLDKYNVPIIDQEPRPGAGNHLVGFLHPKAMGGTLVELVEINHK